jgi:hypothetical protein
MVFTEVAKTKAAKHLMNFKRLSVVGCVRLEGLAPDAVELHLPESASPLASSRGI